MLILVDMDDVLEQLVAGWVELVNEKFGTKATAADVQDWDVSLGFPTLTREQVYSVVLTDELWDHVKPMPGAPEAIKRLMDEGHEIYVVTASDYQSLPAKMEKVLFRYFPFISWDHVIITRNKQIVKGDILIDDAPHNFRGGDYRKILFEAHHNKKFDESTVDAIRVRNWDEAYEAVQTIKAELGK